MAKLMTEIHTAMAEDCDGTDVRLDSDEFGVNVHDHTAQDELAASLRRAFSWSVELDRGKGGEHMCIRWPAAPAATTAASPSSAQRYVAGRVWDGGAELELRVDGVAAYARTYDTAACVDPVSLMRAFLAHCVAAGALEEEDGGGILKKQKLLLGGGGGSARQQPPVTAVVLAVSDAAWAELQWAHADRAALQSALARVVCGGVDGEEEQEEEEVQRPRCAVRVIAEAAAHCVLPEDANGTPLLGALLDVKGAARLARHLA